MLTSYGGGKEKVTRVREGRRRRCQRQLSLSLYIDKSVKTYLDLVELELLVLDSVLVGSDALDGDESLSRGEVPDGRGRVGQVEEDDERPEDCDAALEKYQGRRQKERSAR